MSTPVATIVTDAFREGNIIPVGTAPTLAEQAEAVGRLNAFIKTCLGYDMGEELVDWQVPSPQRTAPVAANFPQLPYPQSTDPEFISFPSASGGSTIEIWQYPPKNSRIVFGSVTSTAYFPEAPDDGSRMAVVQGSGAGDGGMSGQVLTLDGNGRTIGGAATVALTSPITTTMWLYHSELADWVAFATLGYSDNMPFPPSADDYFTLGLAIRMAPRFGKTVSPETALAFKRADTAFKAKFRQAGTTVYGGQQFPRSLQSYITGRRYW